MDYPASWDHMQVLAKEGSSRLSLPRLAVGKGAGMCDAGSERHTAGYRSPNLRASRPLSVPGHHGLI